MRTTTEFVRRLAGTLMCLLAVPALPAPVCDSGKVLYFNHLKSTDSDLSYNCVHAIIQDARGFIWMGTSDGLNRYDGTGFRTFHKEELGIGSDFIISLCEDDAGNIWIGTDSGAAVYDLQSDRFRPFDQRSDIGTTVRNKVTSIKKDRQGVVWMAVNRQGLFSYDPRSGVLKNHFVERGCQTLPADIASFCFDMNNACWLALYFSNLYRVDKEMKKVVPVEFGDRGQPFRGDNVVEILESPYNTLYVASVDKGVCEIAPQNNRIATLIPNASHFVPESMFFDKNRVLWTATTQGVFSYDTESGRSDRFTADVRDRFSLSDSHALSVFIDDADGIWIGTDAGGVSYSGLFHRNFDKYYMADELSLDDALVRGFADDGEGRLWIPTEKQGLLTYSLRSRELCRYRHPRLPKTLQSACFHDGKLWLGSLQGICRLDLATGGIRIYGREDGRSGLRDNKIHVIARISGGELLAGTSLGMLRYDRREDRFVPLSGLERVFVTDIVEDDGGDLWIATYANGLIRYDFAEGAAVRNYVNRPGDAHSLPGNKVLSLLRDGAGRIWAATFGAGFCCYDESLDGFRSYNRATLGEAMPSDINYKIVDDEDGRLWISTNEGLICFAPESGEIKVYTTADGLLDNEFYYNAACRISDGTLFFGSVDGFVRFNPHDFHVDTKLPRIVVTDFRLGDRIVRAGDPDSPLACNVDRTSRIDLPAHRNTFGFGFALLGFASPASNTILCKLEGYDTQWRRLAADNTLQWANVPPGSYVLKVKGANDNGIWNEEHPDIRITVARPFYKSATAILCYVVLFSVCSALCIRYYNRKTVRRERLRQQEEKRAREIELVDEKITFFSSIVHEIKTPLTLIRAPLQNILASDACDESAREDLQIINDSAEYLSRLVKELLDFVHIEYHGYILECREVDIIEKIGFLCFNFSQTARSRDIRLTFLHANDRLSVSADESGLNKILNNLLHNAVKYAGSYVEIEVREEDERVVIVFRNDGPAIPPAQRIEIFKPFVRYNNGTKPLASGVGIGLPLARRLAELHGGTLELADDPACTTFVLTLPLRRGAGQPTAAADVPEEPLDDASFRPVLLVVEDNTELSSYLRCKLQSEFRIRSAVTAELALEMLRSQEIDLLITDIALQGMSGLELCRRVCSDFECSHVPVIVLSAISSTKSKVMAMECGASLYIEKPFNLEYLRACIRSVLGQRAGRHMKESVSEDARAGAALPPYLFDRPRRDAQFLERLDAVIVENLSDPDFSNEQLAEALYLSKSTLNRKMKGLLGTTPNDYIRTKRLQIAARMLTENRGRINEVCYSVGFNTPSYFAKCFRKYYGVLPAEYLKESQANNE